MIKNDDDDDKKIINIQSIIWRISRDFFWAFSKGGVACDIHLFISGGVDLMLCIPDLFFSYCSISL
jgi:hypothetical protein